MTATDLATAPAHTMADSRAKRVPHVKLLGVVSVDGAADVLPHKSLELIAYLATHPAGVTEMQVRSALWPRQDISRGRFNNLVSETRRRLGPAAPSTWWLTRTPSGRYQLTAGYRCDLTEVLDVLARPFNPRAAANALRLVTGKPFDGWTDVEWIFDDNTAYVADHAVHVLAARAAAHARRTHDPVLAGLALRHLSLVA